MAYFRAMSQLFGTPTLAGLGQSTTNLNAAANWYAVSFIAPVTATLNDVRTYVSGKTGTVNTTDARIEIYSNTVSGTNYQPNASVAGPYNCNANITAAGWFTWTPSYAVTINNRYWIVWKNNAGTPASNYYTLLSSLNTLTLGRHQTVTGQSLNVSNTTNSGTTWSSLSATAMGVCRLGFNNGTYYGMPISAGGNDTTNKVYSTREHGAKFTVPSNLKMKVIGGGIYCAGKVGSPTGAPRIRLYTGSSPSLQATGTLETTFKNEADMIFAYWDSGTAVTLNDGDIVRVTLGETTNSDTSSNYFLNNTLTIDSDSNSTGLFPYGMQFTYYDGSTWTDTSTKIVSFFLILSDVDGEYLASGASGGIIVPRTFSGF